MFNTSLPGGSEETLLRIARIDKIGVKDGGSEVVVDEGGKPLTKGVGFIRNPIEISS